MNLQNLLVVNYAMDERHQVFSHQIDLVNELSNHFNKVTVLTAQVGVCWVRDNVNVISFDWAEGKRTSSLFRFIKLFLRCIRNDKYSVLFCHMTSIHSAFIAPVTKFIRLKHYLWYAHARDGIYLRVSKLFTNGIITSTSGSCPLTGFKIYPIGQSIDKNKFTKRRKLIYPIRNFIHISRLDPAKNIELIIDSVQILRSKHPEITLEIVGSPSSVKFLDYAKNLTAKFSTDQFSNWLKFTPYIPRVNLPQYLKEKDAFIHGFQGSLDKALVEATFTALPVVTINQEYLEIFGRWGNTYRREQINLEREALALFDLSEKDLTDEINRRYELALSDHELSGWIDRLVEILKS